MLSYLSELAQLRSENALCCSLRTRSCTGRWGRAAACRERAAARREQEAAGRGGRCAGRDPSKGDALTNIARQALLTETLRRSTSSYSSPSASVSPTACSRRTCVPSLRSTNSTWGPTFTLASRVPGLPSICCSAYRAPYCMPRVAQVVEAAAAAAAAAAARAAMHGDESEEKDGAYTPSM